MIVEMSRSGISVEDIAKNLGVSKGRIRQLLRRSEVKAELAEKQKIFLENLKVADDLDRRWNTRQLIESLGLLTMTTTALIWYYQWAGLEEVSLGELMDLTIPGGEVRCWRTRR